MEYHSFDTAFVLKICFAGSRIRISISMSKQSTNAAALASHLLLFSKLLLSCAIFAYKPKFRFVSPLLVLTLLRLTNTPNHTIYMKKITNSTQSILLRSTSDLFPLLIAFLLMLTMVNPL